MITNYTNKYMLNMNGMLGMNNCGTGFSAGGCNNMLGRIFCFGNNDFYNPCDGTYDYDAMAGWGVANTIANICLGILDQHMASKQAEKAQPSLSDQIADVDAKIQKEADRIGVDAADVANHTIEEDYTTAVTNAEGAIKEAKNDSVTLGGNIKDLEGQIKDLEADKSKPGADTEKIDKDLSAKRKDLGEAKTKKEQLEKDIAENGELTKTLNEAKEAKEKREALIKEVKANVAKLQKQKEALEAQQDAQDFANAAKKADGNIFTRDHNFNVDDFNTKMAGGDSTNNPEIGQRQLKALVFGFTKKDATPAEKQKYAKALQSLSSAKFYALNPDKNQEMIWKAAKEYQTK